MKMIIELTENVVNEGKITQINGPIIISQGFRGQKIGDMVIIGNKGNIRGEIIKIKENDTIIQAYDETEGLLQNEKVMNTGIPLSVELGPGILNNIFDGIQRPLKDMEKTTNSSFIMESNIPALNRENKWVFQPKKKVNDQVNQGDIIGEVQETSKLIHYIMIPFGISGKIIEIPDTPKEVTVEEVICKIQSKDNEKIEDLTLIQRWPIRIPRPYKTRALPSVPLITGTRIIDLLFPIAKGGTVAVPGGFGTGKTIIQHSLAKWSDADIIVYVGCGERGNEIAEIMEQFPKLIDPYTNKPLMERTILIANTSNMPVSSREASIFLGITIAEYFRDMGYHALLLADSTSRWAEALRELSARLEELPAEGGYPAYLSSKLSGFYERAGSIISFGNEPRSGSITIIGAVSPPSADFSEPVTKNTKRFIRAFWALDVQLAYMRHYPAINWTDSYSLYENLQDWWNEWEEKDESSHIKKMDDDKTSGFKNNKWKYSWKELRIKLLSLLAQGQTLANYVQLIGKENLPEEQQLTLLVINLIKQNFLIQNAYNDIDRYSSPTKTLSIASIIVLFYDLSLELIKLGIPVFRIQELPIINQINQLRYSIKDDNWDNIGKIFIHMQKDFEYLKSMFEKYQ